MYLFDQKREQELPFSILYFDEETIIVFPLGLS